MLTLANRLLPAVGGGKFVVPDLANASLIAQSENLIINFSGNPVGMTYGGNRAWLAANNNANTYYYDIPDGDVTGISGTPDGNVNLTAQSNWSPPYFQATDPRVAFFGVNTVAQKQEPATQEYMVNPTVDDSSGILFQTVKGIWFSNDGTKLIGWGSSNIRQYPVDPPFSLDTGTRETVDWTSIPGFSLLANNIADWAIAPGGETAWVVTTARQIAEFTLSTPWDWRTASQTLELDASDIDPDIRQFYGISFNEDGSEAYAIGLVSFSNRRFFRLKTTT